MSETIDWLYLGNFLTYLVKIRNKIDFWKGHGQNKSDILDWNWKVIGRFGSWFISSSLECRLVFRFHRGRSVAYGRWRWEMNQNLVTRDQKWAGREWFTSWNPAPSCSWELGVRPVSASYWWMDEKPTRSQATRSGWVDQVTTAY